MTSASLVLADGPADPPSSRPHRGVLDAPVYRFTFVPADGVQRITLPAGGIVADQDTLLRWAFYADGEEATLAPHAALAVTADVRFTDGSHVSDDERIRDRYDGPLGADAQFAAAWSMPEQWNEDAVRLAPAAGRRGTIEVVLGADGLTGTAPVSGFVQAVIEEAPLPASDLSPAERVDTRRGTHAGPRFSRGNTVPAVAIPHGFTFIIPATDASDSRWPYRAFALDEDRGRPLAALQISHQPSPWIDDRGVLQFVPFRGTPGANTDARRRWITRGTEAAKPHRYAAGLDAGLAVEMTATEHVGAFRVRSDDPDAIVGFLVDQHTDDGGFMPTGDGFLAWVGAGDPGWGNAPQTFAAARVLTAGARIEPFEGERSHVQGVVSGSGAVEVRVALSFISTEQALRSLEDEAGDDVSFDELVARSEERWNAALGRIELPPLSAPEVPYRGLADAELRGMIASNLYRLHLYPNRSSEVGADGVRRSVNPMVPPTVDGAPVVEGEIVVNNGYWDTYRTVWSALALLDPSGTADLLEGLLAQYRLGGFMARWSAPGYVDSMVGTSSDQIFADAERWGLTGDHRTAFESAVRNATEPAPDSRRGRKGIARARFTGYVCSEVHEGMSWSLENAISDAAIGRLARRLSQGQDAYDAWARYFDNRALSYRGLFDPTSGFFRGRDDAGRFPPQPLDPRVWGGDYVETNAWGMSVAPVHDGAGLAELYGSPGALRAHLDALFAEPETGDPRFGGWYGTVIHEQREARALRAGMCGLSNQPAHHIPHMYVHTDEPWRAGTTTRALARRLFSGSTIAQGYPGDEDNGEMSAWWLWALLGLYPLELASGELRLGIPLVDDATVHRSTGTTLRVRVERAAADAEVLVGATLNGEELRSPVLPIDALDTDADLVLRLGTSPEASALWAAPPAKPRTWHPDLTPAASVTSDVPSADRIVDDGAPAGDEGVRLSAGDVIVLELPNAHRLTDATITTLEETSADALSFETRDEDGEWTPLITTTAPELAANRTMPIRFAAPPVATAVQLRAIRPLRLRQVELFSLDPD